MSKIRYTAATLVVVLAGITGTKLYEGKSNEAYVERVAGNRVVTVCYGHTRTAALGQVYTNAQCEALLLKDLNEIYAPAVRRLVTAPLTQGEFNALVDFAYNVGVGNLSKSTLLRLVNARQYDKAALEFAKWRFVNGKDCGVPANKCGGIMRRREWQQQMFVS